MSYAFCVLKILVLILFQSKDLILFLDKAKFEPYRNSRKMKTFDKCKPVFILRKLIPKHEIPTTIKFLIVVISMLIARNVHSHLESI